MMQLLAAFLIDVRWLVRLGGLGLIVIGIIDQSFIPIPGGIDALTIVLTAGNRDRWPWYWLMATGGALLGAYITYRISKKGGKEALEKRLPKAEIRKVEKAFEKRAFIGLLIATLLPPPLPMVPIVVGAGALQYPQKKFLLAIGSGRVVRYGIITWFAHIYGRQIMRVVKGHEITIVIAFLIFSVGAGVGGWLWTKWKKAQEAGGKAHHRRKTKKAA